MDILIYISGQEVSGSVTGTVSYAYAGNDGANTATFTLANPLNQFVLTNDNLDTVSQDEEGQEIGIPATWTLDGMYDETVKKNLYEYKRDSALNVSDPDTTIKRWPLQAGDLIFNKHDPVRIFMHDPRTEEDSWFPVFTGFIDNPGTVTQDYITGKSEFQITCYDIRGIMKMMRVQMNPVIGLVVPDVVIGGEQFFADFIIEDQSLTTPFANTTFEETVEQLIVGSLNGVNLPRAQSGVGEFNLGSLPAKLGSGVAALDASGPEDPPFDSVEDEGTGATSARWKVRYDPESNSTLEAWNDLVLFGFDGNDVGTGDFDETVDNTLQPWTRAKVEKYGRGSTWDGTHSPVKQKMYILLPSENNTGADTLVRSAHAKGGGDTREWESRFSVIAEAVDVLDYHWTVSGVGDIIFEFPMWDFTPSDFGTYSTSYQISDHLIEDELAEEAGQATTILVVTGGVANINADFVTPLPTALQHRAMVISPTMMTKYGATSPHPKPFPFTVNLDSLMILALVEFQKEMSNIGKMDMTFSWRPFQLLNRPILNVQRNRMATVTGLSHSVRPNGMSHLEAELRYLRRPDNDGKFRLLTGGTEMAASYRRRWEDPFNNAGTGIKTFPDLSSNKGQQDFKFTGAPIQENPPDDSADITAVGGT